MPTVTCQYTATSLFESFCCIDVAVVAAAVTVVVIVVVDVLLCCCFWSCVVLAQVELDTAVKSLSVVAAAPELYPALVDAGAVTSLLGLLTHENTVRGYSYRPADTLGVSASCEKAGRFHPNKDMSGRRQSPE